MKIIICGSRNITDIKYVNRAMRDSGFDKKITCLLSGHAKGVDTLGERWRNEQNVTRQKPIELKIFIPDWENLKAPGAKIKVNDFGKEYNCVAGFDRNQLMVDEADAVLAITTGTNGTEDCVERAKKKCIPIYYVNIHKGIERFNA